MYLQRSAVALLILLSSLPVCGGEFLENAANSMGRVKTVQSSFRQEKYLKNFAFPLKISGVMCADQVKNRFAWRVEKPMISNAVITDGKLTAFDGESGKTQVIALDRNPALKMLAGTLQILFAGDVKTMLKDFSAVKECSPLQLIPRQNSVFSNFIKSITFTFSHDLQYIKVIEMVEKSGDRTRIEFFNTSINTPIKDSLWQADYQGR